MSSDSGVLYIKDVDVRENSKGWKVASKGSKYYISKDGKVYMEVSSKHPAIVK